MKLKLIITLLIITIFILEGVQVYFSNRIAGTSIEVATLRQKIEALNEKNTDIKTELLSYSSFNSIASRAAELGFSENKNSVITLTAPLPVALSR